MAEESRSQAGQPSKLDWLLYLTVSILLFPVGIVLGLHAASKPDPSYKKLGKKTLTISIFVGIIVLAASFLGVFWIFFLLAVFALYQLAHAIALSLTPQRSYKSLAISIGLLFLVGLLLLAEFLPSYKSPALSRLQACESNLKNIATALEMWKEDHQKTYPDNLMALVPNYLRAIPQCTASKAAYVYRATSRDRAGRSTVWEIICQGNWHKATGIPQDYPRFSSKEGLVLKPP